MEELTWHQMTPQERINEVGTEPDCPFCGNARVSRTCYIRCNHCGVNWSEGVDIFRDPRIKATNSTKPETESTAELVASF